MYEDASQVTTTLPCPHWCTLPAGHRFHSLTHEGLLMRSHEGPDRSTANVAIGLVADETALSDQGPVVTVEQPTVFVSTDDIVTPCRFTGPQLRQVAAGLLNAADEWDRVTGAPA